MSGRNALTVLHLQEGRAQRAKALNAALDDMEAWLSTGTLLHTSLRPPNAEQR